MKILKIVGIVVLSIIVLIGGLSVYAYFKFPISVYTAKEFESTGEIKLDQQLSETEVKEDIERMIEIMEDTHPIFLEEVPERYYAAKNELLAASHTSMTVEELQNKISRYLSSIQDGHTDLWWEEESALNIEWRYEGGQLVLLDENHKLSDKVVKKIDDVDIDKIIENIKETFPAENYVAEARNIQSYGKASSLLESVGVKIKKDIKLTLQSKGQEENLQVEFGKANLNRNNSSSIYIEKLDDETAYIRLAICEVNTSLEGVVRDIKTYKDEGVKSFIIDVIDNPGGNSMACTMLLEALDMKPGEYGCVIRFSPLAQEQKGYLRKSGSITYEGNNAAVKNDDINLYVLTNERTFSSAQMLCVWVADGKLGTLVGRPSSNMPSSYGDILNYELPHSKLAGQISYKKWTRPDQSKDKERVLEPDIYVEYGDDILEAALRADKNLREQEKN